MNLDQSSERTDDGRVMIVNFGHYKHYRNVRIGDEFMVSVSVKWPCTFGDLIGSALSIMNNNDICSNLILSIENMCLVELDPNDPKRSPRHNTIIDDSPLISSSCVSSPGMLYRPRTSGLSFPVWRMMASRLVPRYLMCDPWWRELIYTNLHNVFGDVPMLLSLCVQYIGLFQLCHDIVIDSHRGELGQSSAAEACKKKTILWWNKHHLKCDLKCDNNDEHSNEVLKEAANAFNAAHDVATSPSNPNAEQQGTPLISPTSILTVSSDVAKLEKDLLTVKNFDAVSIIARLKKLPTLNHELKVSKRDWSKLKRVCNICDQCGCEIMFGLDFFECQSCPDLDFCLKCVQYPLSNEDRISMEQHPFVDLSR